jgi:hypothetical protein
MSLPSKSMLNKHWSQIIYSTFGKNILRKSFISDVIDLENTAIR